MFCVQDNQFISPAVPGTLEKLNEVLDSPRVKWKIETIRSVRQPEAIRLWASNTDFQKFCIKEGLKKKGAGEAFKALTDEEKLALMDRDNEMAKAVLIERELELIEFC